MVLERNKEYYGKPGSFDRIIFKFITDNNVALQVFNQGEIDFLQRLSQTQWIKQTNYPEFFKHANKIYYDYPYYRLHRLEHAPAAL